MMGARTAAAAATVHVTTTRLRVPATRKRPIDVEDLLVWTYRKQKAHVVIGAGRGLLLQEADADGVERHGGSNVAAVERILRLGVMIDQGEPDPGQLHPDAELVHRMVEQLDHRTRGLPLSGLLIMHAKQGDRPDAMVGVISRPEPLLNLRGRIVVEWTDPGKRFGHCPLVYEPSATRILQAREEWALWHRGLRLLALALRFAGLETWRALPPSAPERPWEANHKAMNIEHLDMRREA